jgi:hypothetical protein
MRVPGVPDEGARRYPMNVPGVPGDGTPKRMADPRESAA